MGFNDILVEIESEKSLNYDSRGVKLLEGDDVLIFSLGTRAVFYFRKVLRNENGLFIEGCVYGFPHYIIKLNNFNSDLDSYLDFFNLTRSSSIFYKRYCYDVNELNNLSIYDIMGSYMMYTVLSNYRTKFTSIRSFTIKDILGQKLSVGDLVIYKQENSSYDAVYKYGVLISDTKVLNEDKIIERVCFVYKLTDLNKKERLLLEELSLAYQSMYVSNKNKKNVRGDIYVKGKNIYLFLGKINVYLDYIGESNVINNLKLDPNKEYWIKLSDTTPPANIDGLNKLLATTIFNTHVVYNDKYFINEFIYYRYINLTEITSLIDSIPKGSVYHSSINFSEDIIVSIPKYEFYSSKFHIQLL